MKYFVVSPEVAGGQGENTIFADYSVHPPIISKLHYYFDDWLGDALLTSFPSFIVTAEAGRAIEAAHLTGAHLADVEISKSGLFEDLNPEGLELPQFYWLKISGKPGVDDFGVGHLAPPHGYSLVLSQRALNLFRAFGIDHAEIDPMPSAEKSE